MKVKKKGKKGKKDKGVKIQYGSSKERAMNHDSGFSSKAIAKPEGFTFFRLNKEGTVRIDIIPYRVGKGNPCADEGMVYYERTFYIHRNIGPTRDTYVCPAKTFGKACPVCEHQAKLRRDPKADKKVIKSLNWSERQLFLVRQVSDKKDAEDPGFQIWDMSHFLFGKLLDARVKGADDDDNYEDFFHLEGGKTLKLTVTEESMGEEGGTFYKVTAIDFKDRKDDYPEDVLDEVPCLDDLVQEVSYKELKKKFYAIAEADDDEEEEEEDEEGDDDSDDDDDDDEKPAKKSKKKGKPKKTKAKDDDDDDEDSDDDGDEDDSDDEDGDDDDDADEESEIEVGDKVTFTYKKKERTGKVKKVNTKTGMALVDVKFQDAPLGIEIEELEKAEDEKPAKKSKKVEEKPKKGKKTKKKDDDDEDIEFDEDDSDDDDDADTDDDEESEEEEEEEDDDDLPKRKRGRG